MHSETPLRVKVHTSHRRIPTASAAGELTVCSYKFKRIFTIAVRNKLALGQRESAEFFAGGSSAFSRYENGKTEPSFALVDLLKVLDRHPYLLDEVRTA